MKHLLESLILLKVGHCNVIFNPNRVKLWFFVAFNITISHIISENCIEIPQVVQKI